VVRERVCTDDYLVQQILLFSEQLIVVCLQTRNVLFPGFHLVSGVFQLCLGRVERLLEPVQRNAAVSSATSFTNFMHLFMTCLPRNFHASDFSQKARTKILILLLQSSAQIVYRINPLRKLSIVIPSNIYQSIDRPEVLSMANKIFVKSVCLKNVDLS